MRAWYTALVCALVVLFAPCLRPASSHADDLWINECSATPLTTVTTLSGVLTTGGRAIVQGTNFAQPQLAVIVNGTPVPMQTVAGLTTSTTFSAQITPLAAGTYDVIVTDLGCYTKTIRAVLQVVASDNCSTIYTSSLILDLIGSNAVASGGNLTSWPDTSGLGNNCSIVSANPPTKVAGDSRFSMSPTTVQFASSALSDGGTAYSYVQCPMSFTSSGTIYGRFAIDVTGTSASVSQYIWNYGFGEGQVAPTNAYQTYQGGSFAQVASPLSTAGPVIFESGFTYLGSSTYEAKAALNNNAVVTGTSFSGGILTSGQTLTIGAISNSGTGIIAGAIAEACFVNAEPTSGQTLLTAEYFNGTYGVTVPPGLTFATPITAGMANAPFRISGAGYMAGMTALIDGVSATVLAIGTNPIAATPYADMIAVSALTAGPHNLTLTNVDGRSRTFVGGITATAATSEFSIFPTASNALPIIGDYGQGASLNTSGSPVGCTSLTPCVASYLDYSGMGSNLPQATGADQPAWLASDAVNCNGQPSVTWNGTTDFVFSGSGANMSWNLTTSIASNYQFNVLARASAGAGTGLSATGAAGYMTFATNVPEVRWSFGGSTVAWGSAISAATHNVELSIDTSKAMLANVDNGSAVTGTASTTIGPLNYQLGEANSSAYFAGTTCKIILLEHGAGRAACARRGRPTRRVSSPSPTRWRPSRSGVHWRSSHSGPSRSSVAEARTTTARSRGRHEGDCSSHSRHPRGGRRRVGHRGARVRSRAGYDGRRRGPRRDAISRGARRVRGARAKVRRGQRRRALVSRRVHAAPDGLAPAYRALPRQAHRLPVSDV